MNSLPHLSVRIVASVDGSLWGHRWGHATDIDGFYDTPVPLKGLSKKPALLRSDWGPKLGSGESSEGVRAWRWEP